MRETTSRMMFVAVSAWLSLCLLLLGWMPELDYSLRPIWLISGLLGLASSVGLSQLIKKDIGIQEKLITQYRHAALTDSLTGLANRQALDNALRDALHEFIPHRNPLSLILIDIDHFKHFNDKWGHQAGDAALKTVSRTAAAFFSGIGCVARYGGEEFAIAVPSVSLKEASKLAEEFRKFVGLTDCEYKGQQLKVTVSVGVAELKAKETADDLLHRADKALYGAKHSGRNCIQVSESTNSDGFESVAKNLSLT